MQAILKLKHTKWFANHIRLSNTQSLAMFKFWDSIILNIDYNYPLSQLHPIVFLTDNALVYILAPIDNAHFLTLAWIWGYDQQHSFPTPVTYTIRSVTSNTHYDQTITTNKAPSWHLLQSIMNTKIFAPFSHPHNLQRYGWQRPFPTSITGCRSLSTTLLHNTCTTAQR